jgi:hypothetical protein
LSFSRDWGVSECLHSTVTVGVLGSEPHSLPQGMGTLLGLPLGDPGASDLQWGSSAPVGAHWVLGYPGPQRDPTGPQGLQSEPSGLLKWVSIQVPFSDQGPLSPGRFLLGCIRWPLGPIRLSKPITCLHVPSWLLGNPLAPLSPGPRPMVSASY